MVDRLITAGHWQPGDPDIVIVADTGYDITRLAYVLADLPVELVGRLRSDRVLRLPKPPRPAGMTGRPPKHGPEIALDRPATWPDPQHTTSTDTTRYGTAVATSWDRVHPRLTHRGCWLDHEGELPVIEGTLIRLQVEHLPGDRDPEAGMAVDLHHRRHRGRCGPLVAGVPAPLRPRTHLPAVQADPRLDPPADCATPPPPTAGPGWSSPRTPNSASPARWSPTCAAPGNAPPDQAGSPRPESAAGFGTSARPPCSRPAHRNPADPAPAARAAPATDTPPPATTSERPSNATAPSPHDNSAQVKDQA